MEAVQQRGPLFSNKALVGLTIPIILDALLAIVAGMVDSAMVSSAGETAVSAVSLVDSLNLLFITVFSSVAVGGSVVTAQYVVNITGPALELSNVETHAGASEVEVTVTLHNNPGILAALFSVSLDSGLVLDSAENHVFADGVSYTKPRQYKNPTTFAWDSLDLTWTEDGEILTLFFSVPSTTPKGEYNITLNYGGEIFDGEGNPVDVAVINAVIKVV